MSLEIITNYLEITEDMDISTIAKITLSNNTVKQLAENLKNSDVNKISPTNGRKAIITISADLEKSFTIERNYITT